MNRGFQEPGVHQPPEGHRLSRIWGVVALLIISSTGSAAPSPLFRSTDEAIRGYAPEPSAQYLISSPVEWDKLDRSVIEQLLVEGLGAVIASLPPSPPSGDIHASMRRLNLFVRAGNRLKASEVIDSLPEITDPLAQSLLSEESRKWALAAARAGAHDEAMRLWRLKANIDRGNLYGLSELARLGLKERLRSFYRQLAQDDPASWAPKFALQSLE
jgi:hypothetical protein